MWDRVRGLWMERAGSLDTTEITHCGACLSLTLSAESLLSHSVTVSVSLETTTCGSWHVDTRDTRDACVTVWTARACSVEMWSSGGERKGMEHALSRRACSDSV